MVMLELVRMFSSEWINTTILRLSPSASKVDAKAIESTAISIFFTLYTVGCIVIVISAFSYAKVTVYVLIALCCLLLSKGIYLYFLTNARINDNSTSYRKSILLQSVLVVTLNFSMLKYNNEILTALIATNISYIFGIIFIIKRCNLFYFNFSKSTVLISYGLPIVFAGTLSLLSNRLDRVFIGSYLGLDEAGAYSAMSNLIFGLIALVFMIVAMPLYTELTKVTMDKVELKKRHARYLDILLAITLPAVIGLCFVAEPLIRIFLNAEYLRYGVELFWLMVASIFIFNIKCHYLDHGFQFLMKTKYMPWITLFQLVTSLIIIFSVLEVYGVYGAVVSSLLVNLSGALLSYNIGRRLGYKYSIGEFFYKILFSVFFMSFFLFLVSAYISFNSDLLCLFFLVFSGILTYGVAIFLSGAFELNKKNFMKRFR
jgi:O-antigen/teichoic acid export membrane protein